MMKLSLYRLLFAALALVCVASLAFNAWTLKQFSAYKRDQPVITKYQGGKCPTQGLVGHWTFEQLDGEVARDSSPLHNDGALAFAVGPLTKYRFGLPKLVDGKVGKALEVYGRQWVSSGNNDCFTTQQLTVAAWVWQEDEQWDVPTIAAKSAWPYSGWWLCSTSAKVQKADRYIDFGIAWGTGYAHVESGYQLPLREWHHIVASLDNLNHEAEFFIDGKRFGNKHTNVPTWLVNFDHDMFVGEYDGSGRWPWKGKLDDVRFYNRVLSEQEASALYSSAPH